MNGTNILVIMIMRSFGSDLEAFAICIHILLEIGLSNYWSVWLRLYCFFLIYPTPAHNSTIH